MPTSSKAAAAKKAAAATAESEAKTLEFAGVTVELPPTLHSSFSFRFAQIASLEEKGDARAVGKTYDLLVPRVVSEEHFEAICESLDDSGDALGISDLIMEILAAYGVDAGESEASESA